MTVSMVPRDQPYGQRQQNEAGQRAAGLSPQASQTSPRPQLPPQTRSGDPRPQQQFDGLASREPTGFGKLRAPNTESLVLAEFSQSQSPALRDIARRIRGY